MPQLHKGHVEPIIVRAIHTAQSVIDNYPHVAAKIVAEERRKAKELRDARVLRFVVMAAVICSCAAVVAVACFWK